LPRLRQLKFLILETYLSISAIITGVFARHAPNNIPGLAGLVGSRLNAFDLWVPYLSRLSKGGTLRPLPLPLKKTRVAHLDERLNSGVAHSTQSWLKVGPLLCADQVELRLAGDEEFVAVVG